MAGKAPTYAEQVQQLKAEKQTLIEENERLRNAVESEETLRNEIADLEAKVAAQSNVDNQSNVGLQGKLNDANERANSEAANAKRLKNEVAALQQSNQQLLEANQGINDIHAKLAEKDRLIAAWEQEANARGLEIQRRVQAFTDAIVERDKTIEGQSRELQLLRMDNRSKSRILNEVRAALNEAPDVIGSLKYIVGINGPSTE
jgi:DNA repair exonuclease SbcCD ATPase subunit